MLPGTSYGAAGGPGSLENRTCDWYRRGQPWRLMLDVLMQMGRQLLAISFAAYQVVEMNEFFMTCNREVIGGFASVVCEYSKAHVQCFPVLAVIVSLMIACRTFLFLHFFYRALKRNVLINFPTYEPFRDNVFLLLGFLASQACLHFILNIIYLDELTVNIRSDIAKEELGTRLHHLSVLYLGPAGLFFALLYNSYDIGEAVMPFGKYFAGDPASALAKVQDLWVVPEEVAMKVLQQTLHEGKTLNTADQAFDEFTGRARRTMATMMAAQISLSNWRTICTWWPVELLLDRRLQDEESVRFRIAWYVFSLPVALLLFGDLSLCAPMIAANISDISDGQYEAVTGLVVILISTGIGLVWAIDFSKRTVFRPFL